MNFNDLRHLVIDTYNTQKFQFEQNDDDVHIHEHESGGVYIGLHGSPWRGGLGFVVHQEDRVSYYWNIMIKNGQEGLGYGRRVYSVGEEICRNLGINLIVHTTILAPGFLKKMGCQKLGEVERAHFANRLDRINFDSEYDALYQMLS